MSGLVWVVIAVVAFGWAVLVYNGLVSLRHGVIKAWANIDVLLKQRHEELPKLVETCKQYTAFERDTLERVMKARAAVQGAAASGDIAAVGVAESELRFGLGRLFAVAEAYPELKANEQFRHLSGRISGLENAIADRREFYNESVNLHNVRIEQFPDLIVARLLAFSARQPFEISAAERKDVDLKSLWG